MPDSPLSSTWRARAREAERVQALVRADLVWKLAADELDASIAEEADTLLTPKEAAKECPWSESTIRKMLADGRLPNEGAERRPRVRRRALQERAHGPRLAVVR